jgi:hypothetical protein
VAADGRNSGPAASRLLWELQWRKAYSSEPSRT